MTSESNGTTKVWNWDDWPDIKPRSRRAADDTQTREEISGELKQPQIAVEIRKSGKPGATKAYADIRLDFPDGEIHILGFGIIKQPGKSPWVAFPQNHGENKYFPVVLAKGRIQ